MNNIEDLKYEKIKFNCNVNISDVAFDGKNYYFLLADSNRLIKTDKYYRVSQCYVLDRMYRYISYDCADRCFFLYSNECANTIYIFNCNFICIDKYNLSLNYECFSDITGLSYDCYEDKLMISFSCCIATIDKICHNINIKYKSSNICITKIMSLAKGFLAIARKNDKQYILIFNDFANIINCYCISNCFDIRGMLFNPCEPCDDRASIEIYAIKGDSGIYICKIKIGSCDLGYRIERCNYSICEKSCEDMYLNYDYMIDNEYNFNNSYSSDCSNKFCYDYAHRYTDNSYNKYYGYKEGLNHKKIYNNKIFNNRQNLGSNCEKYNNIYNKSYKNKYGKSTSKYSDISYEEYFFGDKNISKYRNKYIKNYNNFQNNKNYNNFFS